MGREIVSFVLVDGSTSTLTDVDGVAIQDTFTKIPVIYFTEQPTHKLILLKKDKQPYSLSELQTYTGWDFAIAEDFNGTTVPPVRTQTGITVGEETWQNKSGTDVTGGVISIPIDANTTELQTILGVEPYIYKQDDSPDSREITVGTELLGYIAPEAEPSLIVQYPWVFRNRRITSETPPGTVGVDYLTPAQIEALYIPRSQSTVDVGALLNADDYFPVYNKDTGLAERYKISDIATGSQVPPVQNEYVDIATMLADQGNQTADYIQQAGTDFYKKKSTSTADISDYDKVGIEEAPEDSKQYAREDGAWAEIVGGGGGITSVVAGTNIDVNNTDSSNPIVSTLDSVSFTDITLGSANVRYNSDFDLLEYSTGAGDVLKVGLDDAFVFYNDTGAEIPEGRVLHLVAVSTASGHILPTFEIADSSDWEKCQGTLIFTCCAIPIASVGIGLKSGQPDGVDTTGFSAPAQVWLSADGSGLPTTTKPTFPNFSISIGGVANAQVDGTFVINFTTSITDIFNDAWDGAFVESFDFLVTSNGSTITGSLVNTNPTRTMTGIFSSGFHTFDTATAPLVIELTAGTDSTPQKNYIYIPETTKVLTLSTTGWPTGTEHIKISDSFVKTAVTTQTDGVLVNRNWNDHIKQEGNNGHILHLAENLRGKDAEWTSGTEGSVTVAGGATIDIAVTGGKISQLHEQTFSAFDTSVGDKLEVVNDFTSSYFATSDLELVTTDSSGDSLTNTSYKVVIWGVQNKTGQNDKVMVNMPSGTYAKNIPDNAVNDPDNYANYSFPEIFKGKGFLIKEATFVNNGGTISLYAEKDLRGKTPNTVSGGGDSGGTGATTYLALTDTDNSYAGHAGKVPVVNGTETALEFEAISSGGGYAQPSSTNAVATTNSLNTTDTNTFASAADGYVLVDGTAPTHDKMYWLYVSSVAQVEIRDDSSNDALFYVTNATGSFGIRYDSVAAKYVSI